MDSHIVLFLKGKIPDYKGRSLAQLRCMAHYRIEEAHDVIQWMFPTDIKSKYCKDAPILNQEDIDTIKSDEKIQENLQMSLQRMIRFYEKDDVWLTKYNHNFNRITRILRCLWLAGMKHDYVCFQKVLDDIYCDYYDVIGDSIYYWKGANDLEFLKKMVTFYQKYQKLKSLKL